VWRNEDARATSSATQHEADQLDTTSRPRQQPTQGLKTKADAAKQGYKVCHTTYSPTGSKVDVHTRQHNLRGWVLKPEEAADKKGGRVRGRSGST
jgi:hypothetical protein